MHVCFLAIEISVKLSVYFASVVNKKAKHVFLNKIDNYYS